MDGRGCRWRAVVGLTALLAGCRTTPPPTPASAPPSKPAPAAAPAPGPIDPCKSDCLGLAEQVLTRDAVKGLRLLRACLECEHPPPATFARIADLERRHAGPEAALATLRAGTRAHPRSALLWQLRGRSALAANHPEEGLDALVRARALRPDDAVLASEVADAERRYGDAEAKAKRAVAHLLEEAEARFEAQDFAGAEQALRAALAQSAGAKLVQSELHRRLSIVLLSRGDGAGARAAAETALTHGPPSGPGRAALLLTYSDVLLGVEDYASALIAAAQAAELAPDDPLPATNEAIARAQARQPEYAVAALRRAVHRGLPARLTRAEVLALPGFERLSAREDFKTLIDEGWPQR